MAESGDAVRAVPLLHRSPRAAFDARSALGGEDPISHEAAPPPIPPLSPLRLHPVGQAAVNQTAQTNHSQRGVHPLVERALRAAHTSNQHPHHQPQPQPARRHPSKLLSYRTNRRLPPSLQRRTSLETIVSVDTTASVHDPANPDPPSPDSFTLDYELPDRTPSPTSSTLSEPSSVRSFPMERLPLPATSLPPPVPREVGRPSIQTPAVAPAPPNQILKSTRISISPATPDLLEPTPCLSVELPSSSRSGSSSNSSTSRPSAFGQPSLQRGYSAQSKSSSEWSASDHDISGLSEQELKKCKKKGINPALYAEMKAARKGKWISPLAGNTFL